MSNLLRYSLVFFAFMLLICCGKSQAEINAEAQELFEQNQETLKLETDNACAKKQADYINQYKDSLSNSK